MYSAQRLICFGIFGFMLCLRGQCNRTIAYSNSHLLPSSGLLYSLQDNFFASWLCKLNDGDIALGFRVYTRRCRHTLSLWFDQSVWARVRLNQLSLVAFILIGCFIQLFVYVQSHIGCGEIFPLDVVPYMAKTIVEVFGD